MNPLSSAASRRFRFIWKELLIEKWMIPLVHFEYSSQFDHSPPQPQELFKPTFCANRSTTKCYDVSISAFSFCVLYLNIPQKLSDKMGFHFIKGYFSCFVQTANVRVMGILDNLTPSMDLDTCCKEGWKCWQNPPCLRQHEQRGPLFLWRSAKTRGETRNRSQKQKTKKHILLISSKNPPIIS